MEPRHEAPMQQRVSARRSASPRLRGEGWDEVDGRRKQAPAEKGQRMIEVRNLHKAFGAVKAVDGVSFTARDGEITGLLGPNGAGKTTTLRMLYTLMRPDTGRVLVDGIDAAADPIAVRQRLGVLPDARGLYRHLSAREN